MKKNLTFKNYFRKVFSFAFTAGMLLCFENSNAQTITNYANGMHNGWYYSFWTENENDNVSMTLGPDGNYSTQWTNVLNFTAGKGWATGQRDRLICFEGTYNGGSNGFLAVYGWTRNPLIEYYVVESHGQWDPPGNTSDIRNCVPIYSYKQTIN